MPAENFDCPHCSRQQVISPLQVNFGAAVVSVRQCLGCTQIEVKLNLAYAHKPSASRKNLVIYPGRQQRPPKPFTHLPDEVQGAYEQACRLVPVHAGAAGAYARRALEVVLDGMGYTAPTLLKSIEAARAEENRDRRLPKRLLDRLDYIKEVGNFALHVRRDGELSIIEMSKAEVEVCLTIVEDIMAFVFEDPGEEASQRESLNAQLAAANKKPFPEPEGEPLWSAEVAAGAAGATTVGG